MKMGVTAGVAAAAPTESDVLVIGGGIVGATTAFFLRRFGVAVTLLERGLTGQQASGVNFGGIRRQGRAMDQLPLANRALATWYKASEWLGEDIEFLPTGHTRVCYHAHDAAYFDTYAHEARRHGLDLTVYHGAAMHRRYPYLGREVLAASHSPLDGHANPRLAAPAFARAAARAGASVVEQAEIVAVEKSAGVFSVATADGRVFRAAALAVTAGAWSGKLSAAFGEPVPLVARGPQMAVTEPVPYLLSESMGVYSAIKEEGMYFRQIARGNLILGGGPAGPADISTWRAGVLPENTVNQMAQFRRLLPSLAALHVIRVWSGVESYLPDSEPVIGPSTTTDGLFYGFGFCGAGFQTGPGVGETLAELIAKGSTPIPLASFSIGRFLPSADADVSAGDLARSTSSNWTAAKVEQS